jgi:hypothetical protein
MIYVDNYQPEPEQIQMTSRITRKPTLPVKKAAAKISYVRELPGAVFFGDVQSDDIEYAARLQRIRSEYESDDGEEMLWHELSQMGFEPADIRGFVANPTAITSCGYGMPTIPLR